MSIGVVLSCAKFESKVPFRCNALLPVFNIVAKLYTLTFHVFYSLLWGLQVSGLKGVTAHSNYQLVNFQFFSLRH